MQTPPTLTLYSTRRPATKATQSIHQPIICTSKFSLSPSPSIFSSVVEMWLLRLLRIVHAVLFPRLRLQQML
jgi:hypothetical protein